MRKFICLAFILLAFQAARADQQKLSQAYEQQLIERVRGVFSPQAGVEAAERPICATPIFLEVKANWERLSQTAKKALQKEVERPSYNFTEYTYDTPDGHFKIHYVRDGDSAVHNPNVDQNVNGHPDWVDTVAMVLEHVWAAEITALKYKQPPSDDWYPGTEDNGGDGRYDVYLLNLTVGQQKYLGYTDGESFVPGSSTSVTSYIALDNDYIGYGPQHSHREWLEVTVAHEFFHAVQMGYDGAEYETDPFRPYWMEMSAVWMEDMVYDQVNDYLGYLPYFYNHPDWSLKTFNNDPEKALHAYGSCVWPMYLSERSYPTLPDGFDTSIIKDIWQRCEEVPGNNAIDNPGGESATDGALEARGLTFEEAFRDFTVWNFFTGSRARPQFFYSEGDLLPEVKEDSEHTSYPVDLTNPQHLPENLGSSYVVFKPHPDSALGGLRIIFEGHGYGYEVSAVGYNQLHLEPFYTTFLLNPVDMSGEAEIYNWANYGKIVMIAAATDRNPDFARVYDYEAAYDSSLHGVSPLPQSDRVLQNFPNPFVIGTESDRVYFPFVLASPSRVRIDIFTLGGERVRTIVPRDDVELPIGEYVGRHLAIRWDGRNEEGEYVSSGVYLFQFRTDRNTEIRKIAVIR